MESIGVVDDTDEPSEWVLPFLAWFRTKPTEITTSISPNAKWFAKLDAKGRCQILLGEESKDLSTFLSLWGGNRIARVPMGLTSSGYEYRLCTWVLRFGRNPGY
eukprot:TCALIF_14034-PA protein Name:"Protein of unknown function" AED:0.29 eAED:0.40 QI:55/0/0/1/0/0/2/0/103